MSVHSTDSGISSLNVSITEWDLLDEQASFVDASFACSSGLTQHESKNAPLVMHPALEVLDEKAHDSQYGLFGQVVAAW